MLARKTGLVSFKSTTRFGLLGQSLGYGFVNYASPADARKAISHFNGMKLKNKKIKVIRPFVRSLACL